MECRAISPFIAEADVNGNGNGKKKRNRRILYVGIGVAVVLVAVGGLIAAARGGTKIDPSKLAKVERGDLAKSVVATGKVEPITKVEIKSKASGIVKKLLVDAGDRAKRGQRRDRGPCRASQGTGGSCRSQLARNRGRHGARQSRC